VLGNVRARHNDMVKIERSIVELLDLLQILNEQIVQQGEIIQDIAQKTEHTADDLNQANVHLDKGIQAARRTRKLKWWCFGICVLIVIVIALGVGLGVALTRNATKSS
jgi:syntaxin 1B/2/3